MVFLFTANSASKTFVTAVGKRYILRIRPDRGSGPDLKVVIAGGSPITLLNTQQNTISFTPTSGTSTTITVSPISASTIQYYLDQVEFAEDHIYEATLKMSSDYYPFGMQMPGRNTNSGNYRYGYTGKENDLETKGNGNSYDFGNRQYDPRLGRWLSLDPLKAWYPSMTPYCYAGNTPIAAKDPDGNLIIFVNGFTGGVVAYGKNRAPAGKSYWGTKNRFQDRATDFFGDDNINNDVSYVDGSVGKTGFSTAQERYDLGVLYAKDHFDEIKGALKSDDEEINIVAHSMGSAYAEGMIAYLTSRGLKVKEVVHLSSCNAADIKVKDESITRYQVGVDLDRTLFGWRGVDREHFGKDRMIPGVTKYGEIHADKNSFWKKSEKIHNANDYHADTKTFNVWGAVNELRDTEIPKGSKRYSGDGNKYNYIFNFGGLKLQWNYLGFPNKYFMKSTNNSNEYRSVDLDSKTDKPCEVGEWF